MPITTGVDTNLFTILITLPLHRLSSQFENAIHKKKANITGINHHCSFKRSQYTPKEIKPPKTRMVNISIPNINRSENILFQLNIIRPKIRALTYYNCLNGSIRYIFILSSPYAHMAGYSTQNAGAQQDTGFS